MKEQADPYGRGSYCIVVAMHGLNSEEAEVLRDFRDNFVKKIPGGQTFMDLYYYASPSMVYASRKSRAVAKIFSGFTSFSAKIASITV